MENSIKKKPYYNKMANIIYNYPKSSCLCEGCSHECSVPKNGIPTNLSIKNCEAPSCLELSNNYIFKSKIEPTDESGFIAINPQNEMKDIDPSFSLYSCNTSNNSEPVWYGSDPRLKSAARGGSVLPLDRPPNTYNIDTDNVNTDIRLNKYGQNYKSYSDINAGQINYHIDKSRQDAFYDPDFTTSARTVGYLYKDPMGGLKPHYERQPLYYNDPLQTKRVRANGTLSFIEDTEFHRQDLKARQMHRINSQRWEPRWT